jgi:polyisoprenoid-binding protein YceI
MPERLKISLAVLLVTLSISCQADESLWHSTGEQSELRFIAHYDGQPLNGRFSRFAVEVSMDEITATPHSLTVVVEVASADMNDSDVNDELGRPDWFDIARYPQAVFDSESIKQTEKDQFVANGKLALKGIEKTLELPFQWQSREHTATLSGTLDLSRLGWNIGVGEWSEGSVIDDTVQLDFQVTLRMLE